MEPRIVGSRQLAVHDSPDDAWVALHGAVYDVSDFVHMHPGGAHVILAFLGEDITDEFEEVEHSEYAIEMLEKYKVGVYDVQLRVDEILMRL